tara:strand:- start:4961 stop:6493 length:1533 start_codon:yes stop_codon:yes gene_type:complete
MPVDVVWFKKDLRSKDHAPLVSASLSGRTVVCLFILEPERLELDDVDPIHIQWELDCAVDLSATLRRLGADLHFAVGDAVSILNDIDRKHGIDRLLSHEETGNSWSFGRDKRVLRWCRGREIEWLEYPHNGVVRRLGSRDDWKRHRDKRMRESLSDAPLFSKSVPFNGPIPRLEDLGLRPRDLKMRPAPGEEAAFQKLQSFLHHDGKEYRRAISSPTLSVKHGSGLSPYFSSGSLSMKRAVQETTSRIKWINENRSNIQGSGDWIKSLSSFRRRLAWRCHFIQKMEMEPNLDLVAQNPVIDRNMERELDDERFERWKNGETGWPFLDACMRQLNATGWINFRMRAMIMSAASYNLWLPWRETGTYLARQFIDYEPGIHWSQVGMQSGTTGINTIRAYSMTKQGRDQDPEGEYIRKWVPELSMVPTKFIHEPWKMPDKLQSELSCLIGVTYPTPILDEVESRKSGVSRSYAARGGEEARSISKRVLELHGSRSKPRRRKPKPSSGVQKKLF